MCRSNNTRVCILPTNQWSDLNGEVQKSTVIVKVPLQQYSPYCTADGQAQGFPAGNFAVAENQGSGVRLWVFLHLLLKFQANYSSFSAFNLNAGRDAPNFPRAASLEQKIALLLCQQNRKGKICRKKRGQKQSPGHKKWEGTHTIRRQLYLPLFFALFSDSLIVRGHYLAIN